MSFGLTEAFIAMGTALAGALMYLVERLRRDNKNDHGYVRQRLNEIHDDVRDVRHKIDDHISWHHQMPVAEKVEETKPAPPKRARKKPVQS